MIRAVFFDLDGTLLNTQKRIPDSAKEAIRRCRDQGIRFCFATARSPRLNQTLGWTDDDFALFDGKIYSNGACVHFGDIERYNFIDPDVVRYCISEAAAHEGVHLSLHMPDKGYAFNFKINDAISESWGLAHAKIYQIDNNVIDQTLKILMFYGNLTDSEKALPSSLGSKIQKCCENLAKVYITDEGRTIQVTGIEAGKLQAIERIRTDMGLGVDEIAVFGDDINDLEMISYYPNSVAMGNAVDTVKNAAQFVTLSNNEDGVAYALDRLLK